MSFFNFMHDIGKKIASDVEGIKADALKKELDSYKLGTEDVKIEVANGKAVVMGEVKDQNIFEKVILALGNVAGVSEVQAGELTVSKAPAGTPVFYTVKAGDTLWKIAETQYGKGKGGKHEAIFEANKPMLTSPDKIYPGQVLRIPSLG